MRDIGSNIRNMRIRKNITQEDLAERLFITRQAVSSYETSRTKPDIEMLIKIAEALGSDTNTLLYGPQPTIETKKSKRELIMDAITTLLLGIAYIGCNHYLIYKVGHRIVLSIPQNLISVTILPAMWFLIGWTLLHGLLMLPGMPKIQFKNQRKIYIAVWILIGILILMQLPYILFLAIAFYRSLTRTSVTMVFPNIPVYTQVANWLLLIALRANSGCAIWGAVIRFLRPTAGQK